MKKASASLVLTNEGTYIPIYSPDGYDDDEAPHRILRDLCEVVEKEHGVEEE